MINCVELQSLLFLADREVKDGKLGSGVFGEVKTVVREDKPRNLLAMKSSLVDYRQSGTTALWRKEIDILETIKRRDPQNTK